MNTASIIGKCQRINQYLKVGLNGDVVSNVVKCYECWREQPVELVEELQHLESDDEKCVSVFSYLVDQVYYKLDPDGEQQIKSPARLIADGYGDCKSLTIFIASCLHCLGIKHIIRFVDFDGGGQYTHVYPVAVIDGREMVLDMCEKDSEGVILLDYARPYKQKKDFIYQ